MSSKYLEKSCFYASNQLKYCKNLTKLKSPTNFARTYYSIPPFNLNKSKYRILIRSPTLGKNIPTNTEKKQQKTYIFKSVMKN